MSFADELAGDEDGLGGGMTLIATDTDRRGRNWMLFAETDDRGAIAGGVVAIDGDTIFIGPFDLATSLYEGGLRSGDTTRNKRTASKAQRRRAGTRVVGGRAYGERNVLIGRERRTSQDFFGL